MMIKIIYPETRLVSEEKIIQWAADCFENGETETLAATIEEAAAQLEDLGHITVDGGYRKAITPKQRVLKLAASMNVEVSSHSIGGHFEVLLDAPEGFSFDGDIHQMVNSTWDDQRSVDMWKAALERLQATKLEPCPVSCDVCFPCDGE